MLTRPAPRRSALLTLLGLVAALLHVVVQAPPAEANGSVKTEICHRTSAVGNPYRRISVRQSALNNSGHGGHTGTVYPAAGWGDIWAGGPLWTQAAQDVFHGITRTPVDKGGRVACRSLSALQYFDAMAAETTAGGARVHSDEAIADQLNDMRANEDKALLAALGLTSFTAASMQQLDLVSASTAPAATTSSTTVVLHGRVRSGATPSVAAFDYGTDQDLRTSTRTPLQTAATGDRATTATLTGLQPGQQYWFRAVGITAVGTEDEGTLEGDIATFTMPAGAPLASQSLSFEAGTDVTYGAPARSYSFAAPASGNPVVLTSADPTVCSVTQHTATEHTVTALRSGSCALTASVAGNATYAPASVSDAFSVARAPQTVTLVAGAASIVQGSTRPVDATATSGVVPVLSTTTGGACTVDTVARTVTAGAAAGTCTLVATAAQDDRHLAASTTHDLAVVAASGALTSQTIVFGPLEDRLTTSGAQDLGATASSGLPVTYAAAGSCSVTGRRLTPTAVGTCTVTASQAGSDAVAPAADVARVFRVRERQTVVFVPPGDVVLRRADQTRELSAQVSTTSGLPAALTSDTPGVCTASGTVVVLRTTGTCTVTARAEGDLTRTAAEPVSRSFAVLAPVEAPVEAPVVVPAPPVELPRVTPGPAPVPVLPVTPRPLPTSAAPARVVLKDVPRTGLVPVPAVLPREGGAVRRTVQTARSATGLLAPPSTTLGAGVLRPGQATTLPGRFLFDFDSARLTSRGHQVVKDLVRQVAGNQAVTCEGYTDYAGDPGHELDLSARRSVAVCKALQAYGAKVRTATKGYGGSKPVVLGGRATERHDNRRVVVVVTR